ncbi:hypothetical protein OZY43_05275 [Lactobacillus sp. ESL0785]|uniref:hypothetical protein n=1 Tax=Lactobacillus sp. ESL0785 TaxID=2983232 RepID=UPI0023F70F37|nr:hypothetical protein [Lactobacillus sp. ESL0785]WEV70368.1 hypothetical protein OZY43_05275 [Lactobacillus sp. ESL0785]
MKVHKRLYQLRKNLDYSNSVNETLYLKNSGVLKNIRERQTDKTGFASIDWYNL